MGTATSVETSTECCVTSNDAKSGVRRGQHGMHRLSRYGSTDDDDDDGGPPTRDTGVADPSAAHGASAALCSEMRGRWRQFDSRLKTPVGTETYSRILMM